jgi:hypothetical protein
MPSDNKNYYSDVLTGHTNKGERTTLAGGHLATLVGSELAASVAGLPTAERINAGGVALTAWSKLDKIGGILGHLAAYNSELTGKGKEMLKGYSLLSAIPGVYRYKQSLRDSYVDSKLSGGTNKHRTALSELLGSTVSVMGVSGLLGALALALTSRKINGTWDKAWDSAKLGYKIGVGIGGLGSIGSYIIGRSIAKRRTNKEHSEYLTRSVLPNYIIPGLASYNKGRRQAMMDDLDSI